METENMGYLSVYVKTADGALPVEGAMVTIRSDDGENSDVLAVLYTDPGGVTERFALPAPPKSFAQTPEGGTPYRFYSIDTDKTGFRRVRTVKVAIYSEVTAFQPVNLIPLALGEPSDSTEYFEGSAPNL